jgi:hypothetical protein
MLQMVPPRKAESDGLSFKSVRGPVSVVRAI